MRFSLLLVLLFFIQSNAESQSNTESQPFIIRGQFNNSKESFFLLKYKDTNYKEHTDTIKLDSIGLFYREIQIKHPQRVSIQQNNIAVNDLFIAPSYNLVITGNAIDPDSFINTKSIKGIGSNSNTYRKSLDSILKARNEKVDIYSLGKEEYLQYLYRSLSHNDSLATVIFDPKMNSDKYANDFKNLVIFENAITKLYFLTNYATRNNLTAKDAEALIISNIDSRILNSLYNEEYMISDIYRFTLKGNYLSYLVLLDKAKDTANVTGDPSFKIVANNYKGKIKDFVFHDQFNSQINHVVSFEKLSSVSDSLEKYKSYFTDTSQISHLERSLVSRRNALTKTQVGKPAPAFSLASSTGKIYNSKDFIGKVLYLDLWASWCIPCRKETPNLKKLNDKYKNNKNIVIIGIATKDNHTAWKKALKEDKPRWLQLIDKNDSVFTNYAAIWLPRYILIDKSGNIANFDAPVSTPFFKQY